MEKDRQGRALAIAALLVAVVGLSMGFAAFSTSLTINSSANVTASKGTWNVGFSTDDGSTIASVDTATTVNADNSNPGVINVTKYTITQNTNATLATTSGSSVSYTLDIANLGTMDAKLDSVTWATDPITCTNATGSASQVIEGTAQAGTTKSGGNTSTISAADCATMFNASLLIDQTTYTPSSSTVTGGITAGSHVPAVLTISYAGTPAADAVAETLDGDIVVNVGAITVVYTSDNN